MSMNMDAYTTAREERTQAFRVEAERQRLLRDAPRRRLALGRRMAGRLGSMMITAGYRLERLEHGGRPACDVSRGL